MTLEHQVVLAQGYCFFTAFTDSILGVGNELRTPKRVKIAILTLFVLLTGGNNPGLAQRANRTHVICKFRVQYVDKSALFLCRQVERLEVRLSLIYS